jgi:nucleoside-diphosphate-sugar epimerase
VCGYSPRQRLDLSVNILTNHAVNTGKITVFGGSQMRPNIHIDDVAQLYEDLLQLPDSQIAGKIFNAGWENHTISDIAEMVRSVVSSTVAGRANIEIVTTPSDDLRSYHISSEKIRRELGFAPKRSIEDAVRDLVLAFQDGRIPNAMDDIRYYNVKKVQEVGLN